MGDRQGAAPAQRWERRCALVQVGGGGERRYAPATQTKDRFAKFPPFSECRCGFGEHFPAALRD